MMVKYFLNSVKICIRLGCYQRILCSFSNDSKAFSSTWKFAPSQEIEHARNIMLKTAKYKLWNGQINNPTNLIVCIYAENGTAANARLILRFESLARVTQQGDGNVQRFKETLDQVEMNCDIFSDDELTQCLEIFAHVRKNTLTSAAGSLDSLRIALGAACESRCRKWSLNQLFVVCDIWYTIPNGNQIGFLKSACERFEEHLETMSSYQLVQAHFYTARHPMSADNIKMYERLLEKHCEKMSLDELGIVAMGIFRSLNTMSPKIVSYIYQKLLKEDTRQLHDLTLTSFLKVYCRTITEYIGN